MSQVKDIIDSVKHRLPDRANIYPALNRAVRIVSKRLFYHNASMIRGNLAVTIAAAASSGSLPSDFWGLIGKPYISGNQRFIEPIPDQRYKLLYTSTSVPIYYEISGTTILLYPGCTAETVISGIYWARPTALTAATDTMPFNELFDDVIGEAIVLTYSTGLVMADSQARLISLINQSVDEVAPYIDRQAPIQVVDSMQLDSYTIEDM